VRSRRRWNGSSVAIPSIANSSSASTMRSVAASRELSQAITFASSES
jgi:hypothetical protein